MLSKRNPQLNKHGELIHLLSTEGLPKAVLHQILDTAGTFLSVNDREVKKVPLLRGKIGVQPVLREQHPHPHHLRDRRQAPVRRRHQPRHRALQHGQGRDAARHRGQPVGDARGHVRGPPQRVRRALPDRAALRAACSRGQRRRRPPRASDAGPARHVHDPALQEGLLQPDGGDRRRHRALARRAQRHPRAHDAGRAGDPRGRPEDAGAGRSRATWACACATTWPRASAVPTSSSCCACRTSA